MERLGGGGHLTNAACQVEAKTIDNVKTQLEEAIEEVFEGSSD